jgi:UrcA family protein
VKFPIIQPEEIIMRLNYQSANKCLPACIAAMLLAGVLVASDALADEEVRSETVKFADLNVDSQAGVETLYTRLRSAARRVCSETDPTRQYAATECTRNSLARAVEKVNLPLLTAYYQTKTGNHGEPLTAKR